jgi:DNA-binding SARP family transcriptional activator/LysM repeat protein
VTLLKSRAEQSRYSIDSRRERRTFWITVGLLLLAGAALARFAGGPRLPSTIPRGDEAATLLSGASLPLEAVALTVTDLAWLLWGWIAASVVVACVLAAADAATHGARWVLTARHLVDHLSFPMTRRVVAAAFAVQVLARGASVAAAQPLMPPDSALVESSAPAPAPDAGTASTRDAVASDRTYRVQNGDTLWSIAEHEYGSGAAYRALVHANLGRRMPDGNLFTARGVIHAGWELVIPSVSSLLEEDEDGSRWYTVQPGDTLTGIAATLSGDDSAWREIFDANRGVSSADGKHVLRNPNLIWPGLRLRLPDAGFSSDSAPATPEAEPAVELAAASAPSPATPADPVDDDDDPTIPVAAVATVANSSGTLTSVDVPEEASEADDADTPPPLLRTPHALYPIALEPADAPADTGVAASETSNTNGEVPVLSSASSSDFPTGPVALGGFGLAGAAGLALGARRWRRRLRRLPQEPESEVVVAGGFAEAELTPSVAPAASGSADPLEAIVGRVEHLIHEYNLGGAEVVTARHGRSSTSLAISASLAHQALLVDLSTEFSGRLDADVNAWVSADQDVVLQFSSFRPGQLLPAAASPEGNHARLLPVGVLYDRQVFYTAWQRMGHVLIASLPGHGADTILTSLVATLTTRHAPRDLEVWIVAQPRDLPAPVFKLPHVTRAVDPTDRSELDAAIDRLRAELDERAAAAPGAARADLVVVIAELAALGDAAMPLELLASRATASRLGVSLVAATGSPEQALQSPLQPHFSTRMVLRMQDEETSVGILGVADAAFLGGGGRMLLRLEEREAVELYGYQVSNEHLERLVRVMRSAYANPSDSAIEGSPHPPDADVHELVFDDLDADAAPVVEDDGADSSQPGTPQSEDAPASRAPQTPTVPPYLGPPLRVTCFDGPRVEYMGHVVWPRSDGVRGGDLKPWELLLFAACQPSEGVSAEQAAQALWPGGEDSRPASRFRQLRLRLRRALTESGIAPEREAEDGIDLSRGVVRLDPGIVESDAREFLDLTRQGRHSPGGDTVEQLERARALYTGDLLAGPDSRRYAWLDERDGSGVTLREHFRRLFQTASARLGELYGEAGRHAEAIEVYRELTEIDPGDERHWRALYQLHARRGDRLGLLREERRFRLVLRELAAEVGQAGDPVAEEPSRELVTEFQRLLTTLREAEPESAAV